MMELVSRPLVVRVGAVGVLLAGCGFSIPGAARDPDAGPAPADGGLDVAPDTPPPALCDPDPALRLCFSFDQDPLPATLPNEGTADVDATLTAITRTPSPAGGAAQLGPQSSMFVPMHPDVAGVLSVEVSFRVDQMPAFDGSRMGLADSNVSPPNISLFLYRHDPGHQLRCGLGAQVGIWPATLTEGTWHHVACVCEMGQLVLYLDGTSLGAMPGDCGSAGALVADGLTIGSDNTGNPAIIGDRLAGAIDGIRLWSVARTASEIAAAATP